MDGEGSAEDGAVCSARLLTPSVSVSAGCSDSSSALRITQITTQMKWPGEHCASNVSALEWWRPLAVSGPWRKLGCNVTWKSFFSDIVTFCLYLTQLMQFLLESFMLRFVAILGQNIHLTISCCIEFQDLRGISWMPVLVLVFQYFHILNIKYYSSEGYLPTVSVWIAWRLKARRIQVI